MKSKSSKMLDIGLILVAILALGGMVVAAVLNRPIPQASINELVAINLPATSHPMDAGANAPWNTSAQVPVAISSMYSMDAGVNAPWLQSVLIPVTGSQSAPMDAGAGAPWLMNDSSTPTSGSGGGDNRRLPIVSEPSLSSQSGGGR